jgi:hypothetical protein
LAESCDSHRHHTIYNATIHYCHLDTNENDVPSSESNTASE